MIPQRFFVFSVLAGATVDPKNAEEFNILAKAIGDKVSKYQNNKEYPVFVETLVRLLGQNMKAEDLKKISTQVNAMATEKQKIKQVETKKKGLAISLSWFSSLWHD